MPLDLQRIVGPIKAKGSPDDPIFVIVDGISLVTYNKPGSVVAVPDSTKTTIVSAAYSLGLLENIAILSCSGDDYAKFYFTVNGVDIDIRRSGPDRNLQFDFTGAPFALNLGDVIDVKVQHFNIGSLLDFEATIYGYA